MLQRASIDERDEVFTFTVSHPSNFYLPLWAAHYSKIGIIRILEQQSKNFDEYWDRVNEFQNRLLRHYKIVIFANCDEFLVPLDKIIELGMVRPTAYHVVDMNEEPLDLSKPILRQRSMWIRDGSYDKPMIVTEPMEWGWGLHCKSEQEYIPVNPDLYLIHLRKADYTQAKQGNKWFEAHPYLTPIDWPWKEPHFGNWFYDPATMGNLCKIPEEMKELL